MSKPYTLEMACTCLRKIPKSCLPPSRSQILRKHCPQFMDTCHVLHLNIRWKQLSRLRRLLFRRMYLIACYTTQYACEASELPLPPVPTPVRSEQVPSIPQDLDAQFAAAATPLTEAPPTPVESVKSGQSAAVPGTKDDVNMTESKDATETEKEATEGEGDKVPRKARYTVCYSISVSFIKLVPLSSPRFRCACCSRPRGVSIGCVRTRRRGRT